MKYSDPGPDRHAAERDRKRAKRVYGMRMSGKGTRLLWELSLRPRKDKRRKRRCG